MGIPSKVREAGNNSSFLWCFEVGFREGGTSDIPVLEAWDNFKTNSVAHELFTGTPENGNLPMLCAVATTDGIGAPDWKPAGVTPGGATVNRLKGSDSYVLLDDHFIWPNDAVYFNLCWEIPFDVTIPADLNSVLVVRYSYSGNHPVLRWRYCDPIDWLVDLTPGPDGNILKPTDAGVVYPDLILHPPMSGVLDSPEIWVVES